jgi:hypothetical protein
MYLAEVHGLDTLATQCRTDGRRGRGLASAHDELDDLVVCDCFSRHCELFAWSSIPRRFDAPGIPKVPNRRCLPQLPNWDSPSRELSLTRNHQLFGSLQPGSAHAFFSGDTNSGTDPCLYHAFGASSHKITVAQYGNMHLSTSMISVVISAAQQIDCSKHDDGIVDGWRTGGALPSPSPGLRSSLLLQAACLPQL